MRGDRAALAVALVVGVFWAARLVVDIAVYRHEDWPQGRAFVAGHALLVVAFVGIATTYLGLVARHVAGG